MTILFKFYSKGRKQMVGRGQGTIREFVSVVYKKTQPEHVRVMTKHIWDKKSGCTRKRKVTNIEGSWEG